MVEVVHLALEDLEDQVVEQMMEHLLIVKHQVVVDLRNQLLQPYQEQHIQLQ